MQPKWWDNTRAVWGFLIISVGASVVLTYLSPQCGIPVGVVLVALGIFLLLRAYHKNKTEQDKLRESLISARARAEALLRIKADADITGVLKIIGQAYHRYEVAVTYLKKQRTEHPEYNFLINLLQSGQADLNTLKQSELNLSVCKSKIDEDARKIIGVIDDIVSNQIYQSKDTNVKPRDFGIIWLSEKFFLRGSHNDYHSYNSTDEEGKISLVLKPKIRVNTLKLIQIQSIALRIGTKEIPSDMEDVNVFGESKTIDDIKFEFPLDTPRGKQLARIRAIVDGEEYISSSFIIDFPKRNT